MTDIFNVQHMHQLHKRLLQEQQELSERVHRNGRFGLEQSFKDATGDLTAIDNHPADAATEMFERSKDSALLEKEALRLSRVEAALARMQSGEYGRCAECGRFIPLERLEALPTAIYCIEHEPRQYNVESRPVEEIVLMPPFGRTSLDEYGQPGFDGEDAWQIVEAWGSSNSPAMAEDNNVDDYESLAIEAGENDGFVEQIEGFVATDITGKHVHFYRNNAYHSYVDTLDADASLETIDVADDTGLSGEF